MKVTKDFYVLPDGTEVHSFTADVEGKVLKAQWLDAPLSRMYARQPPLGYILRVLEERIMDELRRELFGSRP